MRGCRRFYGAIDLGSLTVRLGVACGRGPDQGWRWLCRREEITALGALTPTGELAPGARSRTLQALRNFVRLSQKLQVTRVAAVATQALRQAVDGPAFLELIRDKIGVTVRLITSTEEAALTWRGIVGSLPPALAHLQPRLAFDLGGGSLEMAWQGGDDPPQYYSLPLSPLALVREWVAKDPPAPEDLQRLRRQIQVELSPLFGWCRLRPPPALLVSSGGAVNTLAALAGTRAVRLPGSQGWWQLGQGDLATLRQELAALPLAVRARHPQLGPVKAALILPAALVVQELLALCPGVPLTITSAGLLEGLLWDCLADA